MLGALSPSLRRLLAALLPGLLSFACSRASPAPAEVSPRPDASASNVPARPDAATASAPRVGRPDAGASPDPSTYPRYAAAMARGRSATKASDWAGARAAFTLALEAAPGNAQALAERGYAAYLAHGYDDADKDLKSATELTKDRVLLGQIWFNQGLVAEARGHRDLAASAYRQSLALRPTPAAKAKVAKLGADTCPLIVDRPGTNGVPVADWLAVYRALAGRKDAAPVTCDTDGTDAGGPATSEQARAILCQSCDAKSPGWIVQTGGYCYQIEVHVVLARPGGLVLFPAVATAMGGRCTGSVNATSVDGVTPGIVHARVTVDPGGGLVYTCSDDAGGSHLCGDDDMKNPGVQSQSACASVGDSVEDHFFDAARGTEILSLRVPTDADGWTPFPSDSGLPTVDQVVGGLTIESANAGVRVDGLGCHETLSW